MDENVNYIVDLELYKISLDPNYVALERTLNDLEQENCILKCIRSDRFEYVYPLAFYTLTS